MAFYSRPPIRLESRTWILDFYQTLFVKIGTDELRAQIITKHYTYNTKHQKKKIAAEKLKSWLHVTSYVFYVIGSTQKPEISPV